MKEILNSMSEAEMDYDGDGDDVRADARLSYSTSCAQPDELQQVVELGRPASGICHAMR